MVRLQALRRWLTLGGRLQLVQPWALATGALALGLALFFPARWLLYLAYVYLLLTLGAYLWVRAVGPRLSLRRSLRTTWAQVGDELEETWELMNGGPLPLLWLEIEDDSTLPGYNARRVVDAEAGGRVSWRTTARCEQRGVYRLGPLTARCGDPIGLFRYQWREAGAQRLVVYPPLVRLPPLTPPSGTRGGLARADLLQLFATPNVAGLRAYVPGDPPGRIHWPYVARYGDLFVKVFDQERSGALWIVLDLAAAAYPAPDPAATQVARPARDDYSRSSVVGSALSEYRAAGAADLAITLAGSLAAQALADGRQVGLLCDDGRRRVVSSGGGQRQLWRILGELVDSEASGERPLAVLLREAHAGASGPLRGGALAVITGDLGATWLPALFERIGGRPGGAMALLVAQRAEYAGPCAAHLAAHSIPTRTFEPAVPLPLLSPPRRRVTARVSPLGRVISEA